MRNILNQINDDARHFIQTSCDPIRSVMAEAPNTVPEFSRPIELEQTISLNWTESNTSIAGGASFVSSPWTVRSTGAFKSKIPIDSYLMHIYAVQSTITTRREIQSRREQRAWMAAISILSLAVGIIAGCAFVGSSWITATTGVLACLFELSLVLTLVVWGHERIPRDERVRPRSRAHFPQRLTESSVRQLNMRSHRRDDSTWCSTC